MAQLTVRLHNGNAHTLEVAEDYRLEPADDGWFTFVGADGTRITVHSNLVESMVVGTGTAFQKHFPAGGAPDAV